uniref:Uncharacterized protein n=1 Tax=Chromera velia CCMP2878 TaxID=1169474 RepID=A0A0G4HD18_9ALVE|eukprot:Cvel_26225.t1-p1 / transcript=Cvel_26225.t1 / gene=Cvel_26225 / organism=Chromera_velia_CCMP2878 / gene_product=hypothetical protein / transcript_product=hypothetical protein / location=Cvel_scaffold3091:11518-12180(+) / protein_length=221 / sequence_SO=supercontig / SO=protein_coding / is_pseudo=false
MFACFPRYNQKKIENDWNEEDLSDYDKIMVEAKRPAAKSHTNAIDEPPGGPPVWVKAQGSTPNPPKQKSPIAKEELAFVGGAGFPPRGKGHRGGRDRSNAGSGRRGYQGSRQGRAEGQNGSHEQKDCSRCGQKGEHDAGWLVHNECPGMSAHCDICQRMGHFTQCCRNKKTKAQQQFPSSSSSNPRGRGCPQAYRGRGGMQAARGGGPGQYDGKAAYAADE